MKYFISIMLAACVALMSAGCGKMSVGPEVAKALTLPPQSSMSVPSFIQTGNAKVSATNTQIAATMAYVAVAEFTLAVELALLEPAALFAICHSTQPVALEDNSGWKWEVGDAKFSAVLVGRVEGDSARWSMTVNGGDLQDFTWYTGTSTITGKAGYWMFYDTLKVAGEYPEAIKISYEAGTPTEQVKLEIVKAGDPDLGNYIQWTAAGDDRTFVAHDAYSEDALGPDTVTIAWDQVTEAGSIQVASSGEKYCWDTKANNHQDIACP
jgi:hypothetical protein